VVASGKLFHGGLFASGDDAGGGGRGCIDPVVAAAWFLLACGVCVCVCHVVCVPSGRLLAGLAVDADGSSWDIEDGFRGWLQALVTALVLGSGLCGSATAGKATKAPTLAKMSTLGDNGRLVQPVWTGGDDLEGSSEVWQTSCL
jgi:hypothetical protein